MMNKRTQNLLMVGFFGFALIVLFRKQLKTVVTLTAQKLAEIMATLKGYSSEQAKRAFEAGTALKSLGLDDERISWVMSQIAFETGHYKNQGTLKDNNLSGIKFYGQPGATPGSKAPSSEGTNPYAHYESILDWAKDYIRIMNKVGKYRPLEASSVEEFVTRLKKNGYFGGDLNDYIRGVKSLVNFYKPFIKLL